MKKYSAGLIIAIVPLLVMILSGCGRLRLITESESDRYCFGCQSAGYALCASGARELKHTSLTRDETEKILLILDNASKRTEAKKESTRGDNGDKYESLKKKKTSKKAVDDGAIINLDGLRSFE